MHWHTSYDWPKQEAKVCFIQRLLTSVAFVNTFFYLESRKLLQWPTRSSLKTRLSRLKYSHACSIYYRNTELNRTNQTEQQKTGVMWIIRFKRKAKRIYLKKLGSYKLFVNHSKVREVSPGKVLLKIIFKHSPLSFFFP